ncbi:DNA translocase FtsK 4TM domain-containing protein [Microbacterium sp. NPDC090281]|uniref:DNA translocase FtsK 4TM domain-containing protein n=1 Tax=Microbacterium sp. NPDC090281 TaxID=3364208 RepID=UPI00381F9A14
MRCERERTCRAWATSTIRSFASGAAGVLGATLAGILISFLGTTACLLFAAAVLVACSIPLWRLVRDRACPIRMDQESPTP